MEFQVMIYYTDLYKKVKLVQVYLIDFSSLLLKRNQILFGLKINFYSTFLFIIFISLRQTFYPSDVVFWVTFVVRDSSTSARRGLI